jgi:hypothetical protein
LTFVISRNGGASKNHLGVESNFPGGIRNFGESAFGRIEAEPTVVAESSQTPDCLTKNFRLVGLADSFLGGSPFTFGPSSFPQWSEKLEFWQKCYSTFGFSVGEMTQ